MPSIEVGTVGGGTHLPAQSLSWQILGAVRPCLIYRNRYRCRNDSSVEFYCFLSFHIVFSFCSFFFRFNNKISTLECISRSDASGLSVYQRNLSIDRGLSMCIFILLLAVIHLLFHRARSARQTIYQPASSEFSG